MKLRTTGKSIVEEVPYGTYVFQCADGSFMGDGEDRLMCVFGFKNDQKKIQMMKDAARHYGKDLAEGGRVVFWSGQRPVSDEEYEEQVQRAKLGLVPDPLDYGAHMDHVKAQRNRQ